MIARTLSFSSPGKLRVHLGQLVYDGEAEVHRTFPIEDLGMVIIDTGLITISTAALQALAENNTAVVVCDKTHHPSAQLLPFAGNSTTQETVEAQLGASEAVNGRLWRQVVRQKVINQATLMKRLGVEGHKLLYNMAEAVKNYDEANIEAQAARVYFQAMVPDKEFKRSREGAWPNMALNYGYAILRAAMARALVGSGLSCIKGIHHHNRYNAFCLADDMMEPYRLFVDQYVLSKMAPFDLPAKELYPGHKKRLLEMLTCDVQMNGLKRPLMVALSYTTASLARYYLKKTDELVLPEFLGE